jgi:hypothetical protein
MVQLLSILLLLVVVAEVDIIVVVEAALVDLEQTYLDIH